MGRCVVRFLFGGTEFDVTLCFVGPYDIRVQDPTDLSIKAGERLLITERNSKDWWTAESDNGRGLVPAAYIKMVS